MDQPTSSLSIRIVHLNMGLNKTGPYFALIQLFLFIFYAHSTVKRVIGSGVNGVGVKFVPAIKKARRQVRRMLFTSCK